MPKELTHEELIQVLSLRISQSSLSQVARELEISVGMLCDVMQSRKKITARIAESLGYERKTVFRKRAA